MVRCDSAEVAVLRCGEIKGVVLSSDLDAEEDMPVARSIVAALLARWDHVEIVDTRLDIHRHVFGVFVDTYSLSAQHQRDHL